MADRTERYENLCVIDRDEIDAMSQLLGVHTPTCNATICPGGCWSASTATTC
jgi:hypothetical protein